MATDVEIERALAAVAATLNERKIESLEAPNLQGIITEALGEERDLVLDGGGGLHDETGARVGAIRRTPSGEWITERQNRAAYRSDASIPSSVGSGKSRSVLDKLKLR